jgi:hypothetical protein
VRDPRKPKETPMRAAQYQAREDLRQRVNTIDRRAEQHQRDAAEAARRADIPGLTQEIEKAREILAQLTPYYADVAAQ